jgi:hypothetical protein
MDILWRGAGKLFVFLSPKDAAVFKILEPISSSSCRVGQAIGCFGGWLELKPPLLLPQTMKASESPNDFSGVNATTYFLYSLYSVRRLLSLSAEQFICTNPTFTLLILREGKEQAFILLLQRETDRRCLLTMFYAHLLSIGKLLSDFVKANLSLSVTSFSK